MSGLPAAMKSCSAHSNCQGSHTSRRVILSGEVGYDIGTEELARLLVVRSIFVDQHVDTGILISPDQIYGLTGAQKCRTIRMKTCSCSSDTSFRPCSAKRRAASAVVSPVKVAAIAPPPSHRIVSDEPIGFRCEVKSGLS